ncbi:DMT family transporter [Agaribacter flavus]|uniref:DMT family transporter n=1 Tax=Agaribacter flavus TaxID=1902781 RepID=A0ABV7FPE1_9ALTE
MSFYTLLLTVSFSLLAFAGNSLLCRLALAHTQIDPSSFTFIRLGSGAIVLALIALSQKQRFIGQGNWLSASALFVYAAAFSWSYVSLDTGTGAFILFATVQISMLFIAFSKGDKFSPNQWIGFVLAIVGLSLLLTPSQVSAVLYAVFMVIAGMAWAYYTIKGKSNRAPLLVSADNFLKSLPFAAVLVAFTWQGISVPADGALYAVISGAVTSGLGYAIWYVCLPHLKSSKAAVLQLSVPVIATFAGILLLDESLSALMIAASCIIIIGIYIALKQQKSRDSASS